MQALASCQCIALTSHPAYTAFSQLESLIYTGQYAYRAMFQICHRQVRSMSSWHFHCSYQAGTMFVIPIRRYSVHGIRPSRTADALAIKHAWRSRLKYVRRPFIAHAMQGLLGLLSRYSTAHPIGHLQVSQSTSYPARPDT